MYITRLQSIDIAINAIKQLPESEENLQAIERLLNLKETLLVQPKWTKELVFKELNKWKQEHGRNPTVTNLVEPGMPKAITIQKLFDMRASAFLNIYYPSKKPRFKYTPYLSKSKDEWINDFVKQYNELKPRSSKDYNNRRDPATPTWNTIARYCGECTWNNLIKLSGVDTSHLNDCNNNPCEYHVKADVPLYKKLEQLLDDT
jgi:hypothetical protein